MDTGALSSCCCSGCCCDVEDQQNTALSLALKEGHSDIVEVLEV